MLKISKLVRVGVVLWLVCVLDEGRARNTEPWQLLRGIFQMKTKPLVLGGLFLILGYFWAMARRVRRPVSAELVSFHRAEQMARLRKLLLR